MASLGFEGSSDRLEGSTDTVGGLIKKAGSKHVFKVPTASVLGLQKLAEEKRKRKEELERDQVKKSKTNTEKSNWEDRDERGKEVDGDDYKERFSSGSKARSLGKSRHYRSQLVETPSHTGGVSDEAREKQLRRLDREREGRKGGVYAESRKGRDKEYDKREKYYSKNDNYKDKRAREYGRAHDKYSDRDRYSERRRERSSREPRSRRNEWENTPSRSSRRGPGDEPSTPQHRSKGILIVKAQHCSFNIIGHHSTSLD